jgi:hypothetical protein
VITAAWPVDPLYNTSVGELLAISECIAIATRQICQSAQFCLPIAQPVVVRIFSNSRSGLAHLQGLAALRHDINLLARPVLDHIASQSAALHQLGANVHLELHWIPGHGHEVQPHVVADTYSRFARIRQTAYSTVSGNYWQLPEEPAVLQYLRQQLADAASEGAVYMSGLGGDRSFPAVIGLAPTPRALSKQAWRTSCSKQSETSMDGTSIMKANAMLDVQNDPHKADQSKEPNLNGTCLQRGGGGAE